MEIGSNRPRHHRLMKEPKDKYLQIRNILNIIFMLGAIAGVSIYFLANATVGTIIILAAMVFKIIECCIRFIH